MDRTQKIPILKSHATRARKIVRSAPQTSSLKGLLTHDEVQIMKRGDMKRISEIFSKSGSSPWIYEFSKSIERGDGVTVRLLL